MRSPNRLALLAAASVLALSLGVGISAAWADDAPAPTVEEVVVSAQKRDEDQQAVPVSTTVFSEDKLQTLGVDSFLDYAKFVPSLSFASLGPGQSDIVLRGMPIIQGVPTVGVYLDGISIASGFTNPDPRLFDVRDVQVLRGPQGTLYGEGAIGGLILIRNNAPNSHDFQAKLDATVSRTSGSSATNGELSGMVNFPLVSDKVGLRVVAFQRSYGGFIDQVSTGQGLIGDLGAPTPAVPAGPGAVIKKDANTERVAGGRVSLGFTPNDTFSLTVTAAHQQLKVGGDSFIMPSTRAQLFPTAQENSVFEDFRTMRRDSYTQISGELVNDFGWATLTGDAGWVSRKLEIDQPFTLATLNTVPGSSDSDPKQFQTEWRLSSPAGQPLQWIAGARYTKSENDILQTTSITNFDFARRVSQSTATWAVFGEGAYTFSSIPVTARVGLRYFSETTDLSSQIVDSLALIANPSAAQARSAEANDVSPRFVVEYRFDPDRMAYFTVAKGFRAGGVNVDLCNATCPTVGFQPAYDPDFVWTYEFGAKTEWLEHRLRLNGAVFYNDWHNLQIDGDPAHPNTGFVTNAGRAHSAGAEVEVMAAPITGLSFNLGASLVRSVLDDAAMGAPAGTRLPNTPKWTFSAGVDYSRAISGEIRGFIHADVASRGNAFGNIPNIPQSATNAPFVFVLRNEAKGFTTANLRLGIENDRWTVTLFGENLTNSRASSFDFDDNAVFGAFGLFTEQQYIARPRTIGLSFRTSY